MPLQHLNDGLYDHLAADSSLTTALGGTAIYHDMIPLNASLPAVTLGLQNGGPENDIPLDTENVVYLVKCISTDSREAETIADLIQTRLHEADVTLDAPWSSVRCECEQFVSFGEQDAREQFYHRGGLYRVQTSK